ncbi:MAG: DUF2336 domain-containing protein [Proteobacteria bacterium]|nr:DUF2336 domain-containing protein [Pseudomonadota bacterium]
MWNMNETYEVVYMDNKVYQEIPVLLALAHDRSENGRLALVEKLGEVFLDQAACLTAKEEKLVNELVEEILRTESETIRRALIANFDKAVSAVRPIALRIAHGPIEIAKNVLVANANLEDDDLIIVIKNKGGDHASAIAQRAHISEAVADALVTTGSLRVMQLVAENLGARLSPTAMNILTDAARIATMLQDPLLTRPDLPSEKAINLCWWASKDLRRAALERYGFGPGRLDNALTRSIEDKMKTHLFEKEDDVAMGALLSWITEREGLSTSLLVKMLRLNHYRLFNLALSHMTDMDIGSIDTIINAHEPRLMVAIAKALDIDKGSFVSLFLMSRGGRKDEQVVHPRELSAALETYDKLSVKDAKAMAYSWKLNPTILKDQIAAHVQLMG